MIIMKNLNFSEIIVDLNEPVLFGSGENTDDPLLNIPLLSTRGLNHLADVIRGQEQLPPLKECGNGWYNFYINFNDAAPSGEADSGRHSVTASLNFITVSENAPDNGRAYEIPIPQNVHDDLFIHISEQCRKAYQQTLEELIQEARKEQESSMRYLVFIKKEFVRDSQAFTGMPFTEKDPDDIYSSSAMEHGWADTEGDVLVMDTESETKEELYNRIGALYPEASKEIFRIIKVVNAEEIS